MKRYLTILEVSQKQAYIFQSNELQKNVRNSAVIAWIMDVAYLEETVNDKELFNKKENLVYSGGGHTVLEFSERERAVRFTEIVTKTIKRDYPGIELFAKTLAYEEAKSPAENLKELIKALERKKSVRRAAFHQGSFGVEKIDTNTLNPMLYHAEKEKRIPKIEAVDQNLMVPGYQQVFKFEELGGTKDESNFIAVVHIDGNAMGKRVEKLQQRDQHLPWEEYKGNLSDFSVSVDADFKAAYREMSEVIAKNIQNRNLDVLDRVDNNFPVRRIITAGDDVCFVTEGRIGLECAAVFLNKLCNKPNKADQEGYAACAGVAIVHQKYPFYKAYKLAEMLCSNAKKYGVPLSRDGFGSDVSMIDWHIEFGEVKDTLDELRADYLDADGNSMSGRPYIVQAPRAVLEKEKDRDYSEVRSLIQKLQDDKNCAIGTLKKLRNALKQGKDETEHFIRFHRIDELLKWDFSENYRMLFDAVELIDTFIMLEDKEGTN